MKPEVKKTYSKLHRLLESYYNSNSTSKVDLANNKSSITGYKVMNMSFGNSSLVNTKSKTSKTGQGRVNLWRKKGKKKFLNNSVSRVYISKQ